ncbi:MAG: LuxR family transcriptional regulator [Deltaproteobacteria bacterium]|nr:LuxR family transcriptional regulator [Deltaproteobacteria bacterium]
MSNQILKTKLFIPQPRSNIVPRPELIKRLNEGITSKLTLICAPAGFGKTTLLSDWVGQSKMSVAWVSLEKSDNDIVSFLNYCIAALKTIEAGICESSQMMIQSPQLPPVESVLMNMINEIAMLNEDFVLILDDYHVMEARPIHDALAFLLDHLPPLMHIIIASRSDPLLPLSSMRAKGYLIELRADHLRFTTQEATTFLNQVMGLSLSEDEINSLETRTEGWIAGLHLAALSMRDLDDTTGFISAFTGNDRYIVDYLVDEVLAQRPQGTKDFLLQTSILDRMNGSLCNALTCEENGQQTLEYLEQANLFIVPLDNERRWYRYHHLFTDLLRQRLHQSAATSTGDGGGDVAELHIRASVWYEDNGLEIEAFQHAIAANDVERAARLVEGEEMPLTFRGAAAPVLNWLASLPKTVLDARPLLWVAYASALNFSGQPTGAEQKLQAAEAALQGAKPDDKTNDIVGHIAAIRAMMAVSNNQVEIIIAQARRALKHLHPNNLPVRTATTWTLGRAYQLQGDRAAASQAYTEVITISQASGDIISTLAATTGLGNIQESKNQLFLAAESYRRGLQLFGDQPQPIACETHLGLARILYEWNDLDAAQQYGQQSIQLARQVESIDTFAISGVFLAHLKLTQGDASGAAALLAKADQFMSQHNFVDRMPEVAAAQVLTLLRQGYLEAAADLAKKHELPLSLARVHLAQGEPPAALATLEPLRQQVEAKGWEAERLKVMVLQTIALHAHGEKEQAVQLLGDVLELAEPGGFIRTFVDEGLPMARLLYEAQSRGIATDYIRKLLAAFPVAESEQTSSSHMRYPESELVEPLSEREFEVLRFLTTELSGPEIAKELMIELSTFRSHTKNIYNKLNVSSRRAAIHKAEDLNLI